MNQCNRPRTNLEIIKLIVFKFIKYLDNNKLESCILVSGIAIGIALAGLSYNQDFAKIIEIFR